MSQYVSDTHALHWHLVSNSKLSPGADRGVNQIVVPGIVLIEFVYLVEKDRLDSKHVEQLFTLLDTPSGSYTVGPLDLPVARALRQIPRTLIPEMPDRIITATALALGIPLITRDNAIQRAGVVPTVW
jgi:PIN domain nuclease of toxin-antitoxin system